MKYLLIATFFFTVLLKTNAQIKSGYVTYGELYKNTVIDTSKIKADNVKEVIIKQEKLISRALSSDEEFYELSFNSTQSLFKRIESVLNESEPVLKFALCPGIYFIDINSSESLTELDIYGETFIIKDSLNKNNWKIENEKKDIGKYTCVKAVVKENDRDIVAWFCPELPFSYGPLGYNGLPGLILELERYGRVYYTKKINISEDNIKIKRPSTGILKTRAEFEKISKKMQERLKEF